MSSSREDAAPSNPDAPATDRRAFVVGTAGHVDHGKSTLVKALTGIDPDRLAEEKARAMTIDLGFAWLTLPSGHEVSVIDVPGHERFVKNMLAGVGGIDAALLVVAADEGPMPQTVEHLAILDLLGIERGVIVLTKADAVDTDWLDLVQEETRERVAGSLLAAAPIVPVSAVTGTGLPELRATLDQVLAEIAPLTNRGRPRLPIDRVFTVAGFGTVVTGTLTGGDLTLGQELRVMPRGLTTRVRGLQTHQTKVDRALPGRRVAVNLSGVAVEQLHRGDTLAAPNLVTPTRRLDARLRLLADSPMTLEQNTAVDFFIGAAELPARITLLDREQLQAAESGWVQIRFQQPVAVLKGDRFIIRRPSPSITIGGGEIVDATPPRHRRFRPEVLDTLETLAAGSPDEMVLHALEAGPETVRALRSGVSGLAADQVDAALRQLIAEGDVVVLRAADEGPPRPGSYVIATTTWEALQTRLQALLAAYHRDQPLRRGIIKEEVRSRLHLSPSRLFDDVIATAVASGVAADDGQTLRLPAFTIAIDPARRTVADRYLAALTTSPNSPPSPAEFGLDADTLGALADLGEIVRVGEGIVFAPAAYQRLVRETLALIDQHGTVTLAGFRDHFQTSRKYAQAMLEYLDQQRITRRVGDERVRYTGPGAGRAAASHEREPAN
ncbi:MAG: selenocysteine-specific translation elongation factor [Chloroflexota bacterium]|nr:selenocysteine-specific translation elongation factor [Chloroflexota bacterium]